MRQGRGRHADRGCGRDGGVDERVGREIELVADEQDGEVRGGEGAGVVEERLEAREGVVRGDVVDEDGARRAAVVGPRDGPEALGSCRVPELSMGETRLRVSRRLRMGRKA